MSERKDYRMVFEYIDTHGSLSSIVLYFDDREEAEYTAREKVALYGKGIADVYRGESWDSIMTATVTIGVTERNHD